jgi:asparagine synthetase B (glutamine-hydrolysing)
MGWGKDGSLWFASEMKALIADCSKIEVLTFILFFIFVFTECYLHYLHHLQWFPPGFYYTKEKGLQPYYKPLYHNLDVRDNVSLFKETTLIS